MIQGFLPARRNGGEIKGPPPAPPKEGGQNKVYKYVTANPKGYHLIKVGRDELKKNPTEVEEFLWSYLRNKTTGFRIRRQHIIQNFVVDFVCLKKKLVIEVDGEIHDQQKEYDQLRSELLNQQGYKVIRFTNEEVLNNPESLVERIINCLNNLP